MTLRPAPKDWVGIDWTQYCSYCGRRGKTKFPAGDMLQLCERCFKDAHVRAEKIEQMHGSQDKDPPARQESVPRRKILN